MSTTDKPWIVQRQYGDPLYFKTIGMARGQVLNDLEQLLKQFKRLGAQDAIDSIAGGIDLANKQFGLSGGRLDVLIDPHSNTWYRVTITKRADKW